MSLDPVVRPLSAGQILARLNALGAAGAAFTDSVFAVVGSSDATKQVVLEVDGLTTGTKRTLTVPDASGTLALLGLAQTWTAAQTINANLTLGSSGVLAVGGQNIHTGSTANRMNFFGGTAGDGAGLELHGSTFPSTPNIGYLRIGGTFVANWTASAFTLSQTTGTTLVVSSTAATCATFAGGATFGNAVTISSGTFILGSSADVRNGGTAVTPRAQINGLDGTTGLSLSRWVASANAPTLYLAKSRGASIGTFGIVSSGDKLGTLVWNGDSGTVMREAARIDCEVDATPGASSMPGRLVFSTTPDGTVLAVEAMRIDNAQRVIIASGKALRLGNAAVAATPTATHTITIQDSTGTTYRLLCVV